MPVQELSVLLGIDMSSQKFRQHDEKHVSIRIKELIRTKMRYDDKEERLAISTVEEVRICFHHINIITVILSHLSSLFFFWILFH